jgi:hypothetical protein
MKSKSLPAMLYVFFMLGILGLVRFSGGVRSVDVVGLFASGIVTGAALTQLIAMLRGRRVSSAQ